MYKVIEPHGEYGKPIGHTTVVAEFETEADLRIFLKSRRGDVINKHWYIQGTPTETLYTNENKTLTISPPATLYLD